MVTAGAPRSSSWTFNREASKQIVEQSRELIAQSHELIRRLLAKNADFWNVVEYAHDVCMCGYDRYQHSRWAPPEDHEKVRAAHKQLGLPDGFFRKK